MTFPDRAGSHSYEPEHKFFPYSGADWSRSFRRITLCEDDLRKSGICMQRGAGNNSACVGVSPPSPAT